jgi:hypothetical protein
MSVRPSVRLSCILLRDDGDKLIEYSTQHSLFLLKPYAIMKKKTHFTTWRALLWSSEHKHKHKHKNNLFQNTSVSTAAERGLAFQRRLENIHLFKYARFRSVIISWGFGCLGNSAFRAAESNLIQKQNSVWGNLVVEKLANVALRDTKCTESCLEIIQTNYTIYWDICLPIIHPSVCPPARPCKWWVGLSKNPPPTHKKKKRQTTK